MNDSRCSQAKTGPRARSSWTISWAVWISLAFASVLPCSAHVGSPDVYAEGNAGPHRLFVTVRPPLVIPGVAEVEVRTSSSGINRIEATPMPLTGEAAKHPPVPDVMQRSLQDAQFYTAHLWLMASGSWQIRFIVEDATGKHLLSIPVPAVASSTRKMQPAFGAGLACLGIFLVAGAIGIVGAAVRDARLGPGETPSPSRRHFARYVMVIAFVMLIAALWLGNMWWKAEAASYNEHVYKPLEMKAALDPGNILSLRLTDPRWLGNRETYDFIPDHDHLMHLYVIRQPNLDAVYHLHPEPSESAEFRLQLPSMPAGTYRLYADVVHADGFPETLVATAQLPAISGRALSGDDAAATAPAVSQADANASSFRLPDGYTMVWDRPRTLRAKTGDVFRFRLLDAYGNPPHDMALYMGMLGHAAFVKTDGTVFAHIHPSGSISMAALRIAESQNTQLSGTPATPPTAAMPDMPGMQASGFPKSDLPNEVGFPYGFPSPGWYRIFVQMKHGTTIETGVFDAMVQE